MHRSNMLGLDPSHPISIIGQWTRACLRALCLLGTLLISSTSSGAGPDIFGQWSLAPEATARSEAAVREAQQAAGKKLSRKEKKRAKKRAQQRAQIVPDVLTTPSLKIRRQDTSHIELVPQKGKKLVVQTNGQAPSLSLSEWGTKSHQRVGFSTWEGDSLVIETTPRQGLHIIHSYHVNTSGMLVQSIELYDGLDAHIQHRIFSLESKNMPPSAPVSTAP